MRSPLAIVFITVFIDLMGFGIVLPVLPYYAESYGASSLTIGLLFTSYSIMQFLFTPVWGRLSDRCGRRPLILLSLAGSCIGFFIFGMADRLSLLFIGRMIAGIAGAIIPTTNAYIADITTPETRAKGMGLVGVAFGMGFILGPAIGGLISPYGYEKAPFLASALAGLNLVFAYFKLPESLSPGTQSKAIGRRAGIKSLWQSLSNPRTGLLLLLQFLVIFAVANMEATFALLNEHTYHLGARQTGYLFTLIGLSMSVAQGLIVGRAVKRFGEKKCIVFGTFAMIFGLALMPFAPNLTSYFAIIVLLAFGAGINNPSVSGLLSRISDVGEQGEIMGFAQSLSSLGRILGPAWGGFACGAFGMQWPYISGGLLMGMAFLLSLRIRASFGNGIIPNKSECVAR
jgi:MFS transporter, DHA1 family, tetracycline resistance protein